MTYDPKTDPYVRDACVALGVYVNTLLPGYDPLTVAAQVERRAMEIAERAADQHLDGYRELAARVAAAENEADRLRARLREVAQILIEHTGESGPMDAEDAARKVVGELAEQIAVNTELDACLKVIYRGR